MRKLHLVLVLFLVSSSIALPVEDKGWSTIGIIAVTFAVTSIVSAGVCARFKDEKFGRMLRDNKASINPTGRYVNELSLLMAGS
jgi:hypothetical protein